jgi:hypothetical protein
LDRPCWLAVCEKANGALTGSVVWWRYNPADERLLPQPQHFATTALSIRTRDDTHDFVTRTQKGPQADGCDIRRAGKDQAHRLEPT